MRRAGALAAAGLLFAACTAPRATFEDGTPAAQLRLSWPRPPAATRIAYLGQISEERDFAPRPSLLRRLARRIFGDSSERLVRPAAVSARGSALAIADPGRPGVHLLDLAARSWTTIVGSPEARLVSPVGVLLLPDGRLLVSDSAEDVVWAYDAAGLLMGRFTEARLRRPTGLAFDFPGQRVWVAETLAHRLRAFDLGGHELVGLGRRGTQPGEFNYPVRLAPDAAGGLWVTDSLNFRLQHVDPSGRVETTFGMPGTRAGAFARPRGLTVDRDGRIFVVDALFDAVQVFDPDGRLLLAFGSRGVGPGEFWLPSDATLDERNRLYVADSYNRRIQVFTYSPPDEH